MQYIVPVSGGKDSQVVLSMAVKKYGAQSVQAVHNFEEEDGGEEAGGCQWCNL